MPLTSTHIPDTGRPSAVPDQLEFWNQWHRRKRTSGEEPIQLELRKLFLRELEPSPPPLRILDLGCGQGHDAIAFVTAGHEVWGMDFSPEALATGRAARQQLGSRESHLTLVEGDIAKPLPFDGGGFDAVYSLFALHYFPDDVTRRIFDEVHRVTRPGGWLALGVKSVHDPYYGEGEKLDEHMYCRKGHVRRFFSEADLEELLLPDWYDVDIETRRGCYVGPGQSVFIRATARKPG